MEAMHTAKNAQELRQAQAVVLPLLLELSLPQTAQALGVCPTWVCVLRRRFAKVAKGEAMPTPPRGGRRRQNLSIEQEQAFLEPFLGLASTGGVIVVASVRQALQARLGRPVALASVYNLLHRHGWRKVVPGKVHPKADPEAQQEWKKTPV
jgi:transposase